MSNIGVAVWRDAAWSRFSLMRSLLTVCQPLWLSWVRVQPSCTGEVGLELLWPDQIGSVVGTTQSDGHLKPWLESVNRRFAFRKPRNTKEPFMHFHDISNAVGTMLSCLARNGARTLTWAILAESFDRILKFGLETSFRNQLKLTGHCWCIFWNKNMNASEFRAMEVCAKDAIWDHIQVIGHDIRCIFALPEYSDLFWSLALLPLFTKRYQSHGWKAQRSALHRFAVAFGLLSKRFLLQLGCCGHLRAKLPAFAVCGPLHQWRGATLRFVVSPASGDTCEI